MNHAVRVRLAGCAVAMLLAVPHSIPARAQAQPVIRLGIGPGDAFSEGYYAQQQGFFKKAGLRVEITMFRGGATIMTGVAAKSIDVGISNVPALAQEISRGAPLVLIAGGGLYSTREPISALCVASGSPLRNPSDFEGKTIAVIALRDQSHLGTLAWLDHSHVDSSKVHFITLPFNEMTAGMESGLADAALLTEPWLTEAVRSGKFRILAKPYDVVAPKFLIGVWFTTREWYAAHSDVAKRFAGVIHETGRWANSHHAQTAKLLSQVSKVDLRTILLMTRTPYATSLDPSLIQPPLDLAFKYHAIDRAFNASDMIAKGDR